MNRPIALMNSESLRSLVITRWGPEGPRGGSALRLFQNIDALASLGSVEVLSITASCCAGGHERVREWKCFDLAGARTRRGPQGRLWARLWRLRRHSHPEMDGYCHPEAVEWLRRRMSAGAYNVVVLTEITMARYLPWVRLPGVRMVYDAHNVECILADDLDSAQISSTSAWGRMSRRVLQQRMAREERRLVTRSDVVWACSDLDASALRQMFGGTAVVVVPNGVNVAAYESCWRQRAKGDWATQPISMLYLGAYSYYPNEKAALSLIGEVLPALKERGHEARVVLVGRDPTPAMAAAAQGRSNVELIGGVDSVWPFLAGPHVLTLPISLGGGTRLKVLEAFAAGVPVVCSSKGMEGIEAVDGHHYLRADSASLMADAVWECWKNGEKRHAMTQRALELVRARYSWESAGRCIAASLRANDPATYVSSDEVFRSESTHA